MINKLNDDFWNPDKSLKKDVRKTLLKIANDFIKFLKIKNLKILDVTFAGSLANFTYHSKSDVDIHIVVELSNFSSNEAFIEEYLDSKKTIWNFHHSIKIYGREVEVYVEKKGSNPDNTGVFSIAKNSWVVDPVEIDNEIKQSDIDAKFNEIKNEILSLDEKSKKCSKSECEKIIKHSQRLIDRLRAKRFVALKEIGEMSLDNQVYKELRKRGMLEKLSKMKYTIYDSMVTLENIYKNDLNHIILEVGNKYMLQRNIGMLHSYKNDKIRIYNKSNNIINYRNIRNRKEYTILEHDLKEFINKEFIKITK